MKLDAEKGDLGKLFDADGNQIHFAVRADTETGEVEVQDRSCGHLQWDGDDVRMVVKKFKAPLKYVRRV